MATIDRLKIRYLRTLVAVAENGSLVKAAHALSITQPAVSKTLAELEDLVGRRLFERSSRGVTLTDAGRVLLRHAGTGLRAIREGLETLETGEVGEQPAVLIGALPNVAATVLPPVILAFSMAVPRARVTVRTGSNAHLIAALRQGALDLVLGRLAEPSDMQGLSFEQLYTERLILVVRPGHPMAHARHVEPSMLRQHRVVLPDAGTRARDAADRFFVANGMGLPPQTLETIDLSFGRSFVLQSDAVWFVPLGAVEGDVNAGLLVRLPLDTGITEGPVGLTQRAGRPPSDVMEKLAAEIRLAAAQRRSDAMRAAPKATRRKR